MSSGARIQPGWTDERSHQFMSSTQMDFWLKVETCCWQKVRRGVRRDPHEVSQKATMWGRRYVSRCDEVS